MVQSFCNPMFCKIFSVVFHRIKGRGDNNLFITDNNLSVHASNLEFLWSASYLIKVNKWITIRKSWHFRPFSELLVKEKKKLPGQDFWLHCAPGALPSIWNESVWWHSAGGERLWQRHVQLWIQPSDFKAIWSGAHENRGDKASTGIWPLSALRVNGFCSPNLLSRCVA